MANRHKASKKSRKAATEMRSMEVESGLLNAKDDKEERPEINPEGGKSKPRLDKMARGGRAKKPSINININTAPHGGEPHIPPALAAMATAAAQGGPPPLGPPGGGPPMPPPGMKPPGGPPMGMKRGGPISGLSTPENNKKWSSYASGNSYASGGAVRYPISAGSESGVGRLQKSKAQGKRK